MILSLFLEENLHDICQSFMILLYNFCRFEYIFTWYILDLFLHLQRCVWGSINIKCLIFSFSQYYPDLHLARPVHTALINFLNIHQIASFAIDDYLINALQYLIHSFQVNIC